MKIIKRLFTYFLKVIKQILRPIKAIIKYPDVHVEPGVTIGHDCKFGKNVKLYKNVIIANSSVGDYTYIGGSSKVKNSSIGKFCSIAPDVKIGLGIHPVDKISTYPGFYSNKASGTVRIGFDPSVQEAKKITIGNDVWIGTGSMILDGVRVGNGAIVAAGSVVTKDINSYEIVGGVPARTIKYRFSEEEIRLLEEFKWWDKGLDFCRKNANLFLTHENFFEYISRQNENDK